MLRRVPFPLLALCLVAALLGTTWTVVTPPFQAPDENAHFTYVEWLSRSGRLPNIPDRNRFSTEQRAAAKYSNSDQVPGNLAAKMTWDPRAWEAWQRKDARLGDHLRGNSGGQASSAANPPLYYAYAALPAKLTAGDNLFTRLAWERLASMLWVIALVVFAWLLAGEVFARDRSLQFVAAGVAGLLPMVQFISASVTPDGMLYAVWTAVLWRGTVILLRGLTPLRALAFLGLVGAACVIKATSYALLPGALLVLAVGAWRLRAAGSRVALRLLAAGGGLAVTLGAWFLIARRGGQSFAFQLTDTAQNTPLHLGDFLSYVYQYYFPRLPGMGHYPFPPYFDGVPFWNLVMREVFGRFGWTEVHPPEILFAVQITLFAVIVLAAAAALARFRRAVPWPVVGFYALTAFTLMAGLQWGDYSKIYTSHFKEGFIQGRYVLPLAALGGLAVAAALRLLPRPRRLPLIAALLTALVMLNVMSMGTTLWRFYA